MKINLKGLMKKKAGGAGELTELGKNSLTYSIPKRLTVIVMIVMIVLLLAVIIKMYTAVGTEIGYELENYSKYNGKVVEEVFDRLDMYSGFIASQMGTVSYMGDAERAQAINGVASVYLADSSISSISYFFAPGVLGEGTDNGVGLVYYRNGDEIVQMSYYDDEQGYLDSDAYKNARDKGEKNFSRPEATDAGEAEPIYLVTSSAPMYDLQGNFMGLAECSLRLDAIGDFELVDGGFETASMFICDPDSYVGYSEVCESGQDKYDVSGLNGQALPLKKNFDKILAAMAKTDDGHYQGADKNPATGKKAFVQLTTIETPSGENWISAFYVNSREAMASVYKSAILIIILMAIGTFAIIYLCRNMIDKALRPITNIMALGHKMSAGDMSKSELDVTTGDEFESLAVVFTETSDTMSTYIGDISRVLDSISNGNLNVDINRDYIGDFNEIKDSLNQILSSLNITLRDIHQASMNVSSGSEQVSLAAQNLSQGAVSQANAVEELTSTINDVTIQVNKNAEDAVSVSENTQAMKQEIENSNARMREMLDAMDVIASRSEEIANISRTIEDIAFQTNILALNASVEAARAGTAGKGFAVVADEVRNLANKSGDAAASTTELIQASLEAVSVGKSVANQTADVLSMAVEKTNGIVDGINVIAQDAKAQAASIDQINIGIEQIANVVQTNSATAEETAASSEELSAQALYMRQLIEKFNLR